MISPREALAAVGQLADVEIDIAGAALQFARIDAPEADWRATEAHLSDLARQANDGVRDGEQDGPSAGLPAGLKSRAACIAGLLGAHRYTGDTENYDDPANANLIRVVERRRGLPVALGVLWLHCARALGWTAHGIDFPGHFLIALAPEPRGPRARHRPATAQQLVIDVFAGGVPLEADDLRTLLRHVAGSSAELGPGVLQPMSARRVLLRLQENLRVRRLRGDDMAGALAATEDMLLIAPDNAGLWREAAVMSERLERPAAAIASWQRFVDLVPNHEASAQARAAIDALRGRLH